LKKQFPKIGKNIMTSFGRGKVLRHNILAGRMSVRLEDDTERELTLEHIVRDKGPENTAAGDGEQALKETKPKQAKTSKPDRHRAKRPKRRRGGGGQRSDPRKDKGSQGPPDRS
jgi:hypothetical protein